MHTAGVPALASCLRWRVGAFWPFISRHVMHAQGGESRQVSLTIQLQQC